MTAKKRRTVERVQTGVRMEKRLVLVLKALAGAHDLTFGDLLEGIMLRSFEGKAPFGPQPAKGEYSAGYAAPKNANPVKQARGGLVSVWR
ncbi:MAG: hypothetical protein ABI467_07340 [Kofleriaceae bacterium]